MKVTEFRMKGEGDEVKGSNTPSPRRSPRRTTRPDTHCTTYHATPAIVDALIALDRRDPNAQAPYQPAIVNRRIVR